MQDFAASINWIQDRIQTNAPPDTGKPAWPWTARQAAQLVAQFPTGLTRTILLAEMENLWLRSCTKNVAKLRPVPNLNTRDDHGVTESDLFAMSIEKAYTLHSKTTATPANHVVILTLSNFDASDGRNAEHDDASTTQKYFVDMILHRKFFLLFEGAVHIQDLLKNGLYGIRLTGAILTRKTPTQSPRFLPTDKLLLLVSKDAPILEPHFKTRLNTITPLQVRQQEKLFNCLVRVLSIAPTQDAAPYVKRYNGRVNYSKIRRVLVTDESLVNECHLLFWDEYCGMADLMECGDWLAIHDVYVHEDCFGSGGKGRVSDAGGAQVCVLEYGMRTVVFCIKGSDAMVKTDSLKRKSAPTDETESRDLTWFPDPFLVKDIRPLQKNITMLGTIQQMISNAPIENSKGEKSDRFGLRLRDSTGALQDVTLWDAVGRECMKLQLGQTVLLQNLYTTVPAKKQNHGDNKCYVVGGSESGTSIFCVSTAMGMLSSPILRKIVSLASVQGNIDEGFYCRAVVTAWKASPDGNLSEYIHSQCTRPLETKDTIPYCKFCHIMPPDHGAHSILVTLTIDDGSQSLDVIVRNRVAEELLQVSSAQFCGCTRAEREEILDRVCGREFEFGVSVYMERKKKNVVRRIDAILPVQDTAVETLKCQLDLFLAS
ncbi:hypothetical protein BJ741DRAFT_628722 [Chytriomyces cf. hyalinus JEL632]|nr:hypothetical protein BJ741DRAFT_628722 [Chytriomyces cf. hyalinus JEL632]